MEAYTSHGQKFHSQGPENFLSVSASSERGHVAHRTLAPFSVRVASSSALTSRCSACGRISSALTGDPRESRLPGVPPPSPPQKNLLPSPLRPSSRSRAFSAPHLPDGFPGPSTRKASGPSPGPAAAAFPSPQTARSRYRSISQRARPPPSKPPARLKHFRRPLQLGGKQPVPHRFPHPFQQASDFGGLFSQ